MSGVDTDEKTYTYTIITTDSNKQLKFLHDRMPVILDPGSEGIRTWLDPQRHEWSRDLQSLLKPFNGDLDIYPVTKEVGKVGNNSPSFIIPLDSRENKSNIANFFSIPSGSSTSYAKQANPLTQQEDNRPTNKASNDSKPNHESPIKRKSSETGDHIDTPLKKANISTISQSTIKKTNITKNKDRYNKDKVSGSRKITSYFK